MRVTALRIHPVKSLGGLAVDDAEVAPWGLLGDRRWALINDDGTRLTAREEHRMLGLSAVPAPAPAPDGSVLLRDRDGAELLVHPPVGAAPTAAHFRGLDHVTPAAHPASAWVSNRLDRSVRLVWQPDPRERHAETAEGGLTLADAGPLLLITEASLTRLGEWITARAREDAADEADLAPGEAAGRAAADKAGSNTAQPDATPSIVPLDPVRFRPNVVVDGEEPFAEDRWRLVGIGGVPFRVTMICDRCVIPTIAPGTLRGGKEPTRTLARHRGWGGKVWFGIRLTPLAPGRIRVGDAVVAER